MADSYRLSVLKALTAHLKLIVPSAEHSFNLSTAVFRGRTVFGEQDPIPMLSLLEAPRSDSGQSAGAFDVARSEWWALMLQGWVADDHANPTDPVYALLDVVEKQLSKIVAERTDGSGRPLYPTSFMLGDTIAGFKYGPGIVRPPQDQVSTKAYFYLPLAVRLVREAGQ